MAFSWTCGGFGLIDYMYFYLTVVKALAVLLCFTEMTNKWPAGGWNDTDQADWKSLLLPLMTFDSMFSWKDFLEMFLSEQIMSAFDDECDMSPYQD